MSVDEQIAVLEAEKQSYLSLYEERIASLRSLRSTTTESESEAPPIRVGSRFRPIPNTGMPASEMILRDRG